MMLKCVLISPESNHLFTTQVREQQRGIAWSIRRAVEERRQHELEQLGEELREAWERERRAKMDALQERYQESLRLLGQGQRSAKENVGHR